MGSQSQQFCVRWNSYQSNLQNAFPKLLSSENFVDVTIACEGQMVKCHKVVLSACSTYFEQLLSHNPCQHPIIFMKDMRFWEVRALVDFMYRGEVNVTQEELNSLLRAAEALQIRGLYGNEQQKVAAAVTKATELNKKSEENPAELEPVVSVNTTIEQKSSPSNAQEDPVHEHMVKLEEDISLMEEQSVSDLEDTQHEDYTTSQEFESFVGDQHYPPPRGTPQAGPSGMTLTPTTMTPGLNANTMDDGAEYMESAWEEESDGGEKYRIPWSEDNKGLAGNRIPIYPHHQLQVQHSMGGPITSSEEDVTNSPNKRIRRSEEELSEAANLISRGLTFQAVSDKYNIPISTIRFYMARKGILPRRKRGRVNRYDEILRNQNFHQNGPPPIQ